MASSLQHVGDYWPRRLLNVKEMISYSRVENGDDVAYGALLNPRYNIMSYTWGRYQDPNGGAITIRGPGSALLPWSIPKIKYDTFTPDEFRTVLEEVAGDCEFVWVDIACINQNPGDEMASEIGNQADIFHRAEGAFLWLHDQSAKDIEEAISAIQQAAVEGDRTKAGVRSGEKQTSAMTKLLRDGWFSSLWTLQEAFLRKDCKVLSKEGKSIKSHVGSDALTLRGISTICTKLHPWTYRPIQVAIDSAGLRHILADNPLVLLSVSLRRTSHREEDRIYGIMQIFGLKLGNTAPGMPSNKHFTLQQLELQLSERLNSTFPSLAQLFVHSGEAGLAKTWALRLGTIRADRDYGKKGIKPGLDMSFHVPAEYYNAEQASSDCEITFSKGTATYRGKVFELDNLTRNWISIEGPVKPQADIFYTDNPKTPDMNLFGRSIFLDESSQLQDVPGLLSAKLASFSKPLVIGDYYSRRQPGQILVLRLGQIKDSRSGEVAWVGMLVRQERDPGQSSSPYTNLSDEEIEGASSKHRAKSSSPYEVKARPAVTKGSRPYLRLGYCTWKDGMHLEPRDFTCTLG